MFTVVDLKTGVRSQFETQNSLFNPILNKITVQKDRNTGIRVPIGRVKEFLQALCTREAIRAAPGFFIINYHQYHLGVIPNIDDILDAFPDDKLWIIPWFFFQKNGGRRNNRVGCRYIYKFNLQQFEYGRMQTFNYANINWENYERQWQNQEQFKQQISDCLNIFENAWRGLEEQNNVYFGRQWELYSSGINALLLLAQGYLNYTISSLFHHNRAEGGEVCNQEQAVQYIAKGYEVRAGINNIGLYIKLLPQINRTNKSYLYNLIDRKANIRDILPGTLKLFEEHNPRLYGLELELTTRFDIKQLINAVEEPFFVCKYDGSIKGSMPAAFELVTVPMSYKAHKKHWHEFFTKLGYDNFDTSKKNNNGIHIHIDKNAFDGNYCEAKKKEDNYHLSRFEWMIVNPANYDFIAAISERDDKQLLQNPNNGGYAHLVQFGEYFDNNVNKVSVFKGMPGLVKALRGAVNIHPSGKTVEIRLFKGIVSEAVILKNLEFVDSLLEFTRKMPFQHCTLEDYLSWMNRQPKNQYKVLRRFLETLKIDEMKDHAELVEKIFLDIDPARIIKKLNTGFNVNERHVSLLNKRFNTEVFELKEGKIIQAPPKEWYKKLDGNMKVEAVKANLVGVQWRPLVENIVQEAQEGRREPNYLNMGLRPGHR